MKKISALIVAALAISGFAGEAAPVLADGWKVLNKDNAKAEKIFLAVAESAPDNVIRTQAILGASYALRYQQKNAQVVKMIDDHLASAPDTSKDARAHLMLFKGNALRDMGKTQEALATYKAGWELNSRQHYSIECAKEYMWHASDRNLKDEAWSMYEASSKDPRTQSNPNYLISGAWTMWKIGKADEGMKMLEAAEKLELTDDRKEMLHRHRGYIQRELLKDYDGAVKSFETAIKFAGNRKSQVAVIWNNIGSAWEKAQEYEKALEAYKKVGTFNVKGWFVKSAEMSAKRMEKKINSGE